MSRSTISSDVFSKGDVAALDAFLNSTDPSIPVFDVDAPLLNTKDKNTPLILAAQNCRTDMVIYLLAHGASVNMINSYGHNAVTALCYTHFGRRSSLLKSHGKCLDALLARGSFVAGSLEFVCVSGCVDCVQKLINYGANINTQNGKHLMTPLMCVLYRSLKGTSPSIQFHTVCAIAELLLNARTDLNLKDRYGRDTLMYASEFGYEPFVRCALDRGGSVTTVDSEGRSALHWASLSRNATFPNEVASETCVSLLLQRGASVNAIDSLGRTALMEAASSFHLGSLCLLLNSRADVNAADHFGCTALIDLILDDAASSISHEAQLSCATLLLSKGASLDDSITAVPPKAQWVTAGSTALMCLVASSWSVAFMQLLLQYGASVDKTNVWGRTALQILSGGNWTKIQSVVLAVDELLDAGADINHRDINGDSILMTACQIPYEVSPSVATYIGHLLKRGADVNLQNIYDQTALLVSFERDLLDVQAIVQLLLYGANVHELQMFLRSDPDIERILQLVSRLKYLSLMDGCNLTRCHVESTDQTGLCGLSGSAGPPQLLESSSDHITRYLFNEWVAREVCTYMAPL